MAPPFPGYIDIHTHILPGVDDGPRDMQDSMALARCYANLGIQKVIATSHFIPGTAWASSKQQIIEKIAEVNTCLLVNSIPVTIYPGMEIAYHKKLQERLENGSVLPLGRSQWYLLEPSFSDSADLLLHTLDILIDQGWKIILAHPERIPALQESGNPLGHLIQQDVRIQVNIGSLFGKFGEDSKRTALNLVANGSVQYLASDAHGTESRRPPTIEQWLELERMFGKEALELLCCSNPMQLLEGSCCK